MPDLFSSLGDQFPYFAASVIAILVWEAAKLAVRGIVKRGGLGWMMVFLLGFGMAGLVFGQLLWGAVLLTVFGLVVLAVVLSKRRERQKADVSQETW